MSPFKMSAGQQLCAQFYAEAVLPLLREHFPGVKHSAARWGHGSEVLGYDDRRSRDHHWGPRTSVFLGEEDFHLKQDIVALMATKLPFEISGVPTHFTNINESGGQVAARKTYPIAHGVSVTTVSRFLHQHLGFDPDHDTGLMDWLLTAPHLFATVQSGPVFHDGLACLRGIQTSLNWYPEDVWRYILANQWRRIDQEAPFMARCGDVGDEIGSRVIANRMIAEIISLSFLMARQYRPYIKWTGTAFLRLPIAKQLGPRLLRIQKARNWHTREQHLSHAYLIIGEAHNQLAITPPVDVRISTFHDRPYLTPGANRFVEALHNEITDEAVTRLPPHVGALYQYVDSTDVTSNVTLSRSFAHIYKR